MKKHILLLLSAGLLIMNSCGDNEHSHSKPNLKNQGPADYEFVADTTQQDVKIVMLADDQMKFNYREITVKEGQNITLELRHTGKINKSTMGHNWVLLKEGVAVNDFAKKAQNQVERDYIPEDTSDIIVHTKLIGGGESDTIVFPAPAKGTYNFLCSFSGHAPVMRGKFIVK